MAEPKEVTLNVGEEYMIGHWQSQDTKARTITRLCYLGQPHPDNFAVGRNVHHWDEKECHSVVPHTLYFTIIRNKKTITISSKELEVTEVTPHVLKFKTLEERTE